jgi:hypothetical protein
MTGLYPMVRRVRRPLLPPDEVQMAVTPPAALPPPFTPPLVKVSEAFTEATKRKDTKHVPHPG